MTPTPTCVGKGCVVRVKVGGNYLSSGRLDADQAREVALLMHAELEAAAAPGGPVFVPFRAGGIHVLDPMVRADRVTTVEVVRVDGAGR